MKNISFRNFSFFQKVGGESFFYSFRNTENIQNEDNQDEEDPFIDIDDAKSSVEVSSFSDAFQLDDETKSCFKRREIEHKLYLQGWFINHPKDVEPRSIFVERRIRQTKKDRSGFMLLMEPSNFPPNKTPQKEKRVEIEKIEKIPSNLEKYVEDDEENFDDIGSNSPVQLSPKLSKENEEEKIFDFPEDLVSMRRLMEGLENDLTKINWKIRTNQFKLSCLAQQKRRCQLNIENKKRKSIGLEIFSPEELKELLAAWKENKKWKSLTQEAQKLKEELVLKEENIPKLLQNLLKQEGDIKQHVNELKTRKNNLEKELKQIKQIKYSDNFQNKIWLGSKIILFVLFFALFIVTVL